MVALCTYRGGTQLEDLQNRYRKWRDVSGGVGSPDGVGVREMLDALVRDGALSKHVKVGEASGKAQVRPKSSTKCAFVLNCVKQNACDDRKPRGFQLPRIEQHRDSILLGGRQKLYMAKLDLSNFFGMCVCLGGGLVNSVYVWDMPGMFGSRAPGQAQVVACRFYY